MNKMCKRWRKKLQSEINIVPFLDVLLVILLILIATAPGFVQSIEINLPSSNVAKIANPNSLPSVTILVSGVEQYSILIDTIHKKQLKLNQIIFEVKQQIKLIPKTAFFVAGAPEVSYNEIIKILNILHILGVTSVGLMTKLAE